MAQMFSLFLLVLRACLVLDIDSQQATKGKRASTLSNEVHRVGYHFSSAVVEKACTSLSVMLSSSGRVIYNQRDILLDSVECPKKKKKSKKRGTVAHQIPQRLEASQAEIDTEASQAIRDLFPRIPQEDLDAVVILAFKKVCLPSSKIRKADILRGVT